jgi:predicted phage terminase large subunit-like protein
MTNAAASAPLDERALFDALLRNQLRFFVEKVFATLKPGETFVDNWHIHAICFHVEALLAPDSTVRRLAACLPPRSTKSLICSVAVPLFVLGHDPGCNIVCISYSDDLAAKHARDRQRILRTDWYRRIFPNLRITRDTVTEVTTSQGGSIYATSVGGTLTGRGGSLFLIDDPLKPADAMSKAIRTSTNEWMSSTLASRPDNKQTARMIMIMQRVHVDDPAGVALRTGNWSELRISAIATQSEQVQTGPARYHSRRPGDVLDATREPLSVYDGLRREMGEMAFSAQYQQEPVAPDGGLFKARWLVDYRTTSHLQNPDRIIQSWDLAFGASERGDYSVGITIAVVKGRFHVLDVARGRWDFPELKARLLAAEQCYPGATVLIERAGVGISLGQELTKVGIHACMCRPDGDKVSRAHRSTPFFEAGRVLLPASAPWLDVFRAELLAFPDNASHDDQVDALVQAINWWSAFERQPRVLIGRY